MISIVMNATEKLAIGGSRTLSLILILYRLYKSICGISL